MRLSKRLKAIAAMIGDNGRLIDVGCDHGLLDIYVTLNHNVECLAIDNNANALSGAVDNINKYQLQDKIKTMKNYGLNNVKINPTDVIVMSGLGTYTVLKILKRTKLDNLNKLIIQSNNDLHVLRKQIVILGYKIDEEKVVIEKGIYYVVIKFVKGSVKYNYMDYYLGPIIRKEDKNYIKYIISTKEDILKHLSVKHLLRIIQVKTLIFLLKKELIK